MKKFDIAYRAKDGSAHTYEALSFDEAQNHVAMIMNAGGYVLLIEEKEVDDNEV